jgi:hypothetical protein
MRTLRIFLAKVIRERWSNFALKLKLNNGLNHLWNRIIHEIQWDSKNPNDEIAEYLKDMNCPHHTEYYLDIRNQKTSHGKKTRETATDGSKKSMSLDFYTLLDCCRSSLDSYKRHLVKDLVGFVSFRRNLFNWNLVSTFSFCMNSYF